MTQTRKLSEPEFLVLDGFFVLLDDDDSRLSLEAK
jgi:hypothetical protein